MDTIRNIDELEVGYDVPALPGMDEKDIQTPCLILDLDALERNIKKMGDYCESCHYSVKLRTGEGACPLNSLYWHFMAQHKERFQSNHRMRMLYGTWNKMGDETQRAVLDQAEHYLNTIEQL